MGTLLSALIVVLGSTLALSPAHAEVRNPDGVAVIIGNKDYEHELIPNVEFAHRDAVAFKQYAIEVLGYDPDNIIQILDGDLRRMEQMFGTKNSHEHHLWSRLNPNGGSDVVVFYSGHGVPGTAVGDHEPRGYLLPTDARPENAVQDGYSVDLLYGNLSKLLEARSIMVYLDACFSGGSDAGELLRDASPVYLAAELPAGDRVTVLTASGGKEIASWDRDNQHGLFTHHLLDALYGSADQDDDGAVTASEVHLYLDRHMTRAARRKYDRSQHAELMGPDGVVLASAPVGGVFPPRVKLREDGTLATDTPVARMAHASVQQDLLLLGMRRAHEAGEYQGVLEYVTKLEDMGEPLPLDALYYQGQAYLHLARNQEAQEVLTEYLTASGREGKHYQDVLEQLLEIEDLLTADDVAFEQAQSVGTAASYEEYLRTHEDGRHAERARRLHAIARDDEAFARARSADTVATYASYLRTYPNGLHVTEVRRLHDALVRQQEHDDKAFSDAKAENTSAAYATYIKTYPNGRHEAEARRLEQAAKDNEAFEKAKVAATSTAYGDYLRARPNGRHVAEARRLQAMARDDEAFASAKAADTSDAYGEYLSRYSEGRHAAEARRLQAMAQDDEVFASARKADTLGAYRDYLRKYSQGRHVAEARRLLTIAADDEAYVRAKEASSSAAYATYLRAYPDGRHVAEVRGLHDALVRQQEQDDKAFSDAKAKDTSAAYATYIKTYPNGRHAVEARRLEQAAKDNEAFEKAKVAATSTAYGDYLRARPNGRHVTEARRLQAVARDDEAFASAKAADTSGAYRDYLRRYSQGRHAGDARRLQAMAQDDEAFASARTADTSGAYRDYLRRYSQGRHAAEARRLRTIAQDDEAYARAKAADTSAAYATYLRAHPNGRHAAEVRQQRALVGDDEAFAKAQESRTSAAYERYLKENPNGRHRNDAQRLLAIAEDDEAFALATEKGTSAAFDEYMKSHPRGRHVDEARRLRNAALRDEDEAERVRAGRVFLDCASCPKMVVVPPGSYLMGSPANEEGRERDEGPVHRVRISKAFAVGVHEITFEEWDYCTSRGGCGRYHPPDGWNWGRGRRPVMDVSWDDAQNYVKWLSRQTGATYRLLSEAEWEYVARAGTTTPYSFGLSLTTRHANYGAPIGGRTSPVGSYRANRFGLYDVHGNVYEWVADCWHDDYHGAPNDGSSWQSDSFACSHRVVRGGSWSNYPQGLRSANRFSKHAVQRYADVGFRVARDLYP